MTIYQLQTKYRGAWVTMQSFSNQKEAEAAFDLATVQDSDCSWQLVECQPILVSYPL